MISIGAGVTSPAIDTGGNPGKLWETRGFASANLTADGYVVFTINTVGFSDVSISLQHQRSGQGPLQVALYYSGDGANYTVVSTHTVSNKGWVNLAATLTGVVEMENNPAARLRLYVWGAGHSNGQFWLDNVQIGGTLNGVCNTPTPTSTSTPRANASSL